MPHACILTPEYMPKKATPHHQFTKPFVSAIAKLANIPVSDAEAESYAAAFTTTMQVVDELQTIDVAAVPQTHQVTGLENVWRADELWPERMFTQEEALANAAQSHNGYFVVQRVIDQEE